MASAQTKSVGPRWVMQYFFDKSHESLRLNDFRFVSPTHGIAVGWIQEQKGRIRPMSLITSNGGTNWEERPLPDVGLSVFFLNDSVGWLVGEKGIYRSDEGGRDWRRVSKPRRNLAMNRVYFINEQRGWAACDHKTVLETKDGGVTWNDLPAAAEPNANPDYTTYNWIEFVSPSEGIIGGASLPPRPGQNRPAWMDPEGASNRREWPTLTLVLETHDGGVTWKAQTTPAFGQATRFRAQADGSSLALFRFANSFDWPSEVYHIRRGVTTKPVYRQPGRMVTDCAWVGRSAAILAAVEPPGKLHTLPIPGKLRMIISTDLTNWTEMNVDYRAFANNAMLSVLERDLAWVATDTGQILRLVP
jgi:hypothetical protein